MKLNRRTTTALLLGAAVAPALPVMAQSRDAFARRLQQRLAEAPVAGAAARLTLLGFGMGQQGKGIAMAAVIQLDWPPGLRRRRFDVFDADAEVAYEKLVDTAMLEFSTAWPGKIY